MKPGWCENLSQVSGPIKRLSDWCETSSINNWYNASNKCPFNSALVVSMQISIYFQSNWQTSLIRVTFVDKSIHVSPKFSPFLPIVHCAINVTIIYDHLRSINLLTILIHDTAFNLIIIDDPVTLMPCVFNASDCTSWHSVQKVFSSKSNSTWIYSLDEIKFWFLLIL